MNSSSNKDSTECGNCGFKDRWLLHHVHLRGEHRRLCTSCVLKLYPTSFCAICFEIYAVQHERIICQKCPSIAHLGCLPNSDSNSVAKSPYLCPSCSNPKYVFFDAKRNGDMRLEVDVKKAKVFLCAARIAVESMKRAVHVAEADAHKRVKEAAVSRKRAREALEGICALVAKEKMRILGELDSRAVGSAKGIDRNGFGSSCGRDRMVIGNSTTVLGASSSVGLQNRASSQGMVLGFGGNLSVELGDDKIGKTSNGDVGRSAIAGNGISENSTNVNSVSHPKNPDGKSGTSPSNPAEDGK